MRYPLTKCSFCVVICFLHIRLFSRIRNFDSPPPRSTAAVNQDGKVTIFYNLYLGNESDMDRVTDIIKEQFSHLKSRIHGDIFVTSIGVPIPNLQNFTNVSKVTVLNYTKTGAELITLQNIRTYCSRNTGKKVAYLHSKGSYHGKKKNTKLRRVLTFATLSNECATVSTECDVCSLRMSPLPHAHASGNMWLSHCSYIAKLLDPFNFSEMMGPGYGNTSDSYRGVGRYAAEHWVHSHPSVQPCDLYQRSSYVWEYKKIPNLKELQRNIKLEMAPRFPFHRYQILGDLKKYQNFSQRLEEYENLYGQEPTSDWWGWDFYEANYSVYRPSSEVCRVMRCLPINETTSK